MFVFCLFETVCQCLEELAWKCVRGRGGGAGGGLHMCVTMIATLHGEKQTPQETHIYPLAGKFYKPERSTFIRPLPPPQPSLHGITRWSGSAKNPLGAAQREWEQCVWEKKPNYVTLESNGWGWETGGGPERPEMERKTKEQWETDLLQDSCSLSGTCSQRICSPFF